MIFSLAGCGNGDTDTADNGEVKQETYTIRYATQWAEGSAFNELIEQKFIARLDEMSEGRLKIEVYPSGSIGGFGTALDAMQDGVADMAYDMFALYSGVYPYVELLETPGWLVESSGDSTALIQEYMETFKDEATKDMKIIGVVSTGAMGVSSKKPLRTIEDFDGFPLRVTGAFVNFYDDMGCTPTVLSSSDIYESIKLNVIDGAMISDWVIKGFNLQEITDYFTYMRTCSGTNVFAMNQDFYESLPADLQTVVDEWSVEVLATASSFYDTLGQEVVAPQVMEENPNFEYIHLDAETEAKMVEIAMPYIEAKAEELNALGLDGTGAKAWLEENYSNVE
jgi:TRAP-type C4-dicarboxylate transport system substrate-binding protein